MARNSRQYYDGLLANPNIQRGLTTIRAAEGTENYANPYAIALGGREIPDLSWHPGNAYSFTQTDGTKNKSTASGAYQFLKGTWNSVAKQLGLNNFSPRNQDIAALALIDGRGGLDNLINGDMKGFVKAVRKEWASLPGAGYKQKGRSWAFIERAWNEAGKTLEAAQEAGLYDTVFGPQSPTPNEDTYQIAPGMMNAIFGNPGIGPARGLEQQATEAGLYDSIMGPAGAPTPYMPAGFPTPTFAPRGSASAPQQEAAPPSPPQMPVNMVRPSNVGPGLPAADIPNAPPVSAPTQSPHVETRAPQLNTPPAEYQHPAFSEARPKVNAFQQPPVPGLQPVADSNPLGVEPQLGVPVPTARPDTGGFGLDAVPADQIGNAPRSTASKIGRGLAPVAASALAGPLGGLAVRGLQSLGDKRAQSDPGYFPDAPKSGGGFFGNIFGSSTPVTGNTTSVADIVKSGPGSASYAGSGMSGIQGVMSSTGPGVANPSIGAVAASRSNPGFSTVSLGPVGYGRQSSKYGWTETVTPFGTSFSPHSTFSVTVDPETGRRSVSRVDTRTGKMTPIAATRGPSRGFSFGRGPAKGIASFFSSLFGPTMTTPAPAVNPAAVAFAPGPTTGPMGFSPGGLGANGAGFGFSGLAGSFGPGGPAFGGGAHSNSTDSRGL